jgi:hypothetical protein
LCAGGGGVGVVGSRFGGVDDGLSHDCGVVALMLLVVLKLVVMMIWSRLWCGGDGVDGSVGGGNGGGGGCG